MSKVLTNKQIKEVAESVGLGFPELYAVVMIESRGSGFLPTGEPKILFERHVFWRELKAIGIDPNEEINQNKELRTVLDPIAGGYGKESIQHDKLQLACTVDRDCALKSASWGLGQCMGFNWKICGYESLQDFINAMYKDEKSQLEAMVGFIKSNRLISALNTHSWASFAVKYNGSQYKKNNYDIKLAEAYKKACKINV
jgi:hypothetical protein